MEGLNNYRYINGKGLVIRIQGESYHFSQQLDFMATFSHKISSGTDIQNQMKTKMFIILHSSNLQALIKCQILPLRWENCFASTRTGKILGAWSFKIIYFYLEF